MKEKLTKIKWILHKYYCEKTLYKSECFLVGEGKGLVGYNKASALGSSSMVGWVLQVILKMVVIEIEQNKESIIKFKQNVEGAENEKLNNQ